MVSLTDLNLDKGRTISIFGREEGVWGLGNILGHEMFLTFRLLFFSGGQGGGEGNKLCKNCC